MWAGDAADARVPGDGIKAGKFNPLKVRGTIPHAAEVTKNIKLNVLNLNPCLISLLQFAVVSVGFVWGFSSNIFRINQGSAQAPGNGVGAEPMVGHDGLLSFTGTVLSGLGTTLNGISTLCLGLTWRN